MVRRIIATVLLAFSFFSFATLAFAQVSQTDVNVNISPEYPGPNQSVTVSLQSYSVTLPSVSVVWSVDGKTVLSGTGKTDLTFTTSGVGQSTNIVATVSIPGNLPIVKNITVTPMDIDLLWQATDSSVPPLYRGKALPGRETTLKFVAMPNIVSNGNSIAPGNLVYTWNRNYNQGNDETGYGEDSFSFTQGAVDSTEHIDLGAQTVDGSLSADSQIDVTPISQQILFYEDSPLYGPDFSHAYTDNYAPVGTDDTLIAEPLYFSPNDPTSSDFTYTWNLNGDAIATPAIPNVLSLHRQSTSAGTAALSVEINNTNSIFQDVTANLTLLLK